VTFTKTIANKDPWGMPSDGTPYVAISPKTKHWERCQYHRASRRQALEEIKKELADMEEED
jgi:hypothetical protein